MARKGYVSISLPESVYAYVQVFIKDRRDLRYHSVTEFIIDALNCQFKHYGVEDFDDYLSGITKLPPYRERMEKIRSQLFKIYEAYEPRDPRSIEDYVLGDGTAVMVKLRNITSNNSPWFLNQLKILRERYSKVMIIAPDFDPSIKEAVAEFQQKHQVQITLVTENELMKLSESHAP